MESKRKKTKGQKHTKYTEKRKTACGLVSTKASFVAFVENEEVDEDDNHILNGSKLIVTWSESIRSDGLTIFENEAVIKFSPLAFYSKITRVKTCSEKLFESLESSHTRAQKNKPQPKLRMLSQKKSKSLPILAYTLVHFQSSI